MTKTAWSSWLLAAVLLYEVIALFSAPPTYTTIIRTVRDWNFFVGAILAFALAALLVYHFLWETPRLVPAVVPPESPVSTPERP
jgi:hypothetical protein